MQEVFAQGTMSVIKDFRVFLNSEASDFDLLRSLFPRSSNRIAIELGIYTTVV